MGCGLTGDSLYSILLSTLNQLDKAMDPNGGVQEDFIPHLFSPWNNNQGFGRNRRGAGSNFVLNYEYGPRVLVVDGGNHGWLQVRVSCGSKLWKCAVVGIAGGLSSQRVQQDFSLPDLEIQLSSSAIFWLN